MTEATKLKLLLTGCSNLDLLAGEKKKESYGREIAVCFVVGIVHRRCNIEVLLLLIMDPGYYWHKETDVLA